MKKLLLAAAAVAGLSFGQAYASPIVLDFDAFAAGSFTGTLGTEDGITISAMGGVPYIDDFSLFGNPLNGFFNDETGSTSTFSFVGSGLFTFDTLDIVGGLFGGASGDVTVEGYLGGVLQASDTFSPTSSFTTVSAAGLAGLGIDRLDVLMPEFGVSADNLVLGNSIPEPTTLALLGLGLAGVGWSRRKQTH
jgi:hypothetical protein